MYLVQKVKFLWQHNPKLLVVGIFLVVGLVLIMLVALSALVSPRVTLLAAENGQSLTEPLVVKFTLPPYRRSVVVTMDGDVDFTTRWSGGFFGHFSRTLLIIPEGSWSPKSSYQLSITDVAGAVRFGKSTNAKLAFTTQGLPGVLAVSAAKQKEFAPDSDIAITLTDPAENIAEFYIELTPKVSTTTVLSGKDLTVKMSDPLKQGQKYRLKVVRQLLVYDVAAEQIERRLSKEIIYSTTFKTRAPALVESFTPQGTSVLPTQEDLTINFSEAMNRNSVLDHLKISPAVDGQWRWLDNKKLRFIFAKKLPIDTKFTVSISAGAKASSGSFIDTEEKLSFKTVGNLKVVGVSPGNGQGAVNLNSAVAISFDQPLNRQQALSNLSITPKISFTSSWQANTLTIKPTQALNYSTNYVVRIAAGVKSTYGKPLKSDYQLSFTSELKKVLLNIPLDYQDRALSCEAAALKMALRYRGVNVSESDIMALVGYDPTIKSGNKWGDPDVAFVGNIDGSQNSTGYGVHWGPIAQAASKWRTAKAFRNWTPAQLASTLDKGNPVVIWGVLGNAYFDPWYTKNGRYIAAWKGEHARTAIGYIGSPSNPVSFIINDPIVGRVVWPTATLKANWGTFSNSGVVVY